MKTKKSSRKKAPTFFSPVSDWGFKKIFFSEPNKNLLIYLLNNIIDDKNIVDVELLNTEHELLSLVGGKVIFDVYCRCDDGSRIIVECQSYNDRYFKDRAFVYSSLAILDQAELHWDYNLDKLYFICITTSNIFRGGNKCITKAMLMNLEVPGQVVYDNYLQIYVELSKFVANDAELNSARDELLYVLKNLYKMDSVPDWIADKGNELTQICNTALFKKLSKTEKEDYMSNEERERAFKVSLENTAKTSREEGRKEGMEKGLQEGMEKGRIEMAKAMKENGVPAEMIAKCSGMSLEQIAAL